MRTIEQLNFQNSFAKLAQTFYSRVPPTPLSAPYLVSFNADAAVLIDLHHDEVKRAEFAEHFIGNRLLVGSEPLAMLYAGHQFGHFVPQLGDGRAIMLGEVKNRAGESWEIQLKGSGSTPYSRSGDGRAVLRSSIREYLCSEAMHGLGIPTTRALCIVGSDEEVYRERIETAAVVTRMAPSHIRFGSFEVFYYRDQKGPLAQLADYVIANHYPTLLNEPDKYAKFLDEVVARTAKLMAQWQAVGFAHGVMNTDNMSILGLTFDYGPFGFLDNYNPSYICNHSDHGGRYAYDQQPRIGLWNLSRLAQALTPIISVDEANAALAKYEAIYAGHYVEMMCLKLGLRDTQQADFELVTGLLEIMQANQIDYTNFFRALGNFNSAPDSINAALRDQFIDRAAFDAWTANYRHRLQAVQSDDAERKVRMNSVNPKYILRNYLAQVAIQKAEASRDFSEVDRLLHLLKRPF
ncbi:MAG: YdiU family protein, partial [Gallionellaceae bacterium]|nr:YdiU family protein [Gallionellaceae bacterium]